MDFVWEVTDRLISGEIALVSKDQVNAVPSAEINQKLGEMSAELRMMSNTLADHSVQLSSIGETVSKAEQAVSFSNYYLRTQMRSGYDENWKHRQNRNISAVSDFIGVDGKRLLQEIYKEMESRYGIDLNAFAKDYKRTKGLSACSTLSVISFSLTLREMFDAVIKEVMNICRLSPVEDSAANKSRIFTMAAEAVVNHSDDLSEA